MFGYSHLTGGFAGGQAEYVRVPFADVGPIKIENDLPDEKVLFLSDIFPTAYMGAEMCDIQPGDVVAVWGAGPVGLLAMASARLLGAEKIIAIDRVDYRLEMAREKTGALTINYEDDDVMAVLNDITAGRGPDACIDAVGMEAHSDFAPDTAVRPGQAGRPARDGSRGDAAPGHRRLPQRRHRVGDRRLRRTDGQVPRRIVDEPLDHTEGRPMPRPALHRPLLERIERGEIDPSFVITHRLPLDQAPDGYETFKHKEDECVKVVLSV